MPRDDVPRVGEELAGAFAKHREEHESGTRQMREHFAAERAASAEFSREAAAIAAAIIEEQRRTIEDLEEEALRGAAEAQAVFDHVPRAATDDVDHVQAMTAWIAEHVCDVRRVEALAQVRAAWSGMEAAVAGAGAAQDAEERHRADFNPKPFPDRPPTG